MAERPAERPREKRAWWRDPSLITMGSLLAVVSAIAFALHGVDGLLDGGVGTLDLIRRAGPALVLGFLLAGFLTVLFPPSTVGRFMGDEAGMRGVVIGAAAGVFSPGGPYVMYPIAAALMSGGAGITSLAAFTAARNLFTANRFLVYEMPFLGPPLAIARALATVWLVIVAVALVPLVFRLMPRSAQEAARNRIGRDRKGGGA